MRWAACIAGLWAGVLLGIGLIGAPAGFATSLPETAGRAVGRMFKTQKSPPDSRVVQRSALSPKIRQKHCLSGGL